MILFTIFFKCYTYFSYYKHISTFNFQITSSLINSISKRAYLSKNVFMHNNIIEYTIDYHRIITAVMKVLNFSQPYATSKVVFSFISSMLWATINSSDIPNDPNDNGLCITTDLYFGIIMIIRHVHI